MTQPLLYASAFLATIVAALCGFFFVRRVTHAPPLRLATGWNVLHKRWSTWLTMAGAALLSAPDAISHALDAAWNGMPIDLRGTLPSGVVQGIGWGLIALKFVAVLIQQRRLTDARPSRPLVGPRLDGERP